MVGLVAGVTSGFRGVGVEEQLRLRVVDAETGQPVAGAEVRFLDPDASGPRPLHGDQTLHGTSTVRAHRSERVDALGSIHRTDEKGELRLPPFDEFAYVSASHDGLYDFDTLRAGRGEAAVLELVPDATIRVRVVDPQGEPAVGVPVAIRRYTEAVSGGPPGGIDISGGKGKGRTVTTINVGGQGSPGPRTLAGIDTAAADGIAEFRHVQEIIGERKAGQRHTLAIASPLVEPVEAEIGSDGWPDEPLVLQLPETGELEVLVVDAEGKPLNDPLATITLGQLPEQKDKPRLDTTNFPDFRSAFNRDRVVWVSEGRALFPFVGLGLELEAALNREWLSGPLDVKGFGPTEAGERATLTVQCPVPDSRLKGRVLDEEGKPLASTELAFWTELVVAGGMATSTGYVNLHTDDGGRFDVLIGPGPTGPGPAGDWETLKFSIRDHDRATGSTRLASFEFDVPLEPGTKDLGDVVLALPPLLVSGIVVDDEGEPVSGASIHVEVKEFLGPAPKDPAKERPFFWRGSDAQSRSGPDGRFEIRWELDREELQLTHFNRATGELDTLVVSRGDTEVRFVVPKGK